MPPILGIIFFAAVLGFSVYRYWRWINYIRRKWRMIPLYEQAARRAKGLCGKCGYDLRGTPERCPECGEVARERDEQGHGST